MSASLKATPFLDQLSSAKKTNTGLFLFEKFLSAEESEDALSVLNSKQFPWDLKPKLYGESLPQHAYLYRRPSSKKKKNTTSSLGIDKLENICQKIESSFDGKISDVYCNRFEDPKHHIDWHKDTYGRHIFVLTLGSTRRIQFRENKTKEVEEMEPKSGDIYFMPLALNHTHKHRVCAAGESEDTSTRLSFVFFFEPPTYAKQHRISWKDRLIGMWEDWLS